MHGVQYASKEALIIRDSGGTVTDTFLRRVRGENEPLEVPSLGRSLNEPISIPRNSVNIITLTQDVDNYNDNKGNCICFDDDRYDTVGQNDVLIDTIQDPIHDNDDQGLADAIIGGALLSSGVIEGRVTKVGGGGKDLHVNEFADLWEGGETMRTTGRQTVKTTNRSSTNNNRSSTICSSVNRSSLNRVNRTSANHSSANRSKSKKTESGADEHHQQRKPSIERKRGSSQENVI